MRMVMGGALAAILALGAPASADDLMKKAQENFTPIPSVVPAMKDNAVTHEKVELGKLLFFDPRLSASEIISCTPVTISPPAASTPGRRRSDTAGKKGRAAADGV
jgi:cytochrome c peroxidase